MRRRLFALCATALLSALPLHAAVGQTAAPKHKLVIQVSDNDPAKWNLALNNAKNVQADLGAANVDLEIVAYGPGINMLKMESVAGPRIAEALNAGVQVVACENTMRAQHVNRSDMLDRIGYVKAGVVELMVKQQQGYSYVRP